MKSTLARKISSFLVVGMMAIGSVAPVTAQESIMGNPRDNNDSPYDVQRFGHGFDGSYARRGGGYGYNRSFRGYNRPFLYGYGRPLFYGPRYGYSPYFYGPGFGYGYGYGGGGALAAGIFGLALGSILSGAIVNRGYHPGYGSSHVQRCEARFRSYDPGSDSYMGYDGYRHRCNM